MKKKIFELFTFPLVWLFSKANNLVVNLLERMQPVYAIKQGSDKILFFCNNALTLSRAKTLFEKEPDTIQWINSFEKDAILYDIGANVGVYTIYAAKKGINVLAFEPESQNYAMLNKNIYLNKLQDKVQAYNIAFSNVTVLGSLNVNTFLTGGSLNSFESRENSNNKQTQSSFKQAVLSFQLDDFVQNYKVEHPCYIKIDVDGLEKLIVDGALKTLSLPSLKGVLIEIDTKLTYDLEIVEIMQQYGFQVLSKYRSPIFDNTAFSEVYNYIFAKHYG